MGEARRWSWGAEPVSGGQWDVRLWAPEQAEVRLRCGGREFPMEGDGSGWLACEVAAEEGTPYAFVLQDGLTVPDPAARRQSGDVHAPSLLTAPVTAPWADWAGRPWEEAVIYELHIGTFTEAGTFRAAIDRLDHVAEIGFTAIELMPVAQFMGNRGWGYDGVLLYAPHSAYGTPDDLRALVQAAHDRGLMVLLDVVYNHFGPDGNYLPTIAPAFFDESRHTPWGAAIAYEKEPVRRYFVENALYWLAEYGFDGLRFDAIDHVLDPSSDPEILIEMARTIRQAFPDRPIHLTTEDNRNVTHLHEREEGRVTLHTAEWNDDLHNAAHVIATGEIEGYYADYAKREWELFGRALAEGYAFQGDSDRGGKPPGEPSGHLPPAAFVDFIQNHDQVGNRAFGERLPALASAPMVEALTAILLLSPHIPLMFMGEEYGETRPFCFFADFEGDLARAVTEGRRREFADFSAFRIGDPEKIPDPIARTTFEASKLDWNEVERPDGQHRLGFVRELLRLRQAQIVPRLAGTGGHAGRALLAESGSIAVDWQLDGALLQLRSRLREGGPDLPPAEGEELSHAGRDDSAPFARHWLKVAS